MTFRTPTYRRRVAEFITGVRTGFLDPTMAPDDDDLAEEIIHPWSHGHYDEVAYIHSYTDGARLGALLAHTMNRTDPAGPHVRIRLASLRHYRPRIASGPVLELATGSKGKANCTLCDGCGYRPTYYYDGSPDDDSVSEPGECPCTQPLMRLPLPQIPDRALRLRARLRRPKPAPDVPPAPPASASTGPSNEPPF